MSELKFGEGFELWQLPDKGRIATVMLIALALVAIDISLAWAGTAGQFQRFGSIIIVVGVVGVALSRHEIGVAESLNEDWEQRGVSAIGQREAEAFHYRFFSRALPAAEFGAIAVGTLQSGYGDLLIRWFSSL